MKSTSEKEALVAIGHRLQKYYTHHGYSKGQIAKRLNVPVQYLNRINEGNNFNSELLVTIRQCFPDLDVQWLLTGKGEMLRQSNATAQSSLVYRHQKWVEVVEKACAADSLHSDTRKAEHVDMLLKLLLEIMMHRGEVLAKHADLQLAIIQYHVLVNSNA